MQTALTAFGDDTTDDDTDDDTDTTDHPAPDTDGTETDDTVDSETPAARKPWTDPRVLQYLYCDRKETFSLRGIANDVFDGRVNREKVRTLLHEYDLMDENRYNRVDRIMQAVEDDAVDSPVPESETDVDYKKYTLAGQAGQAGQNTEPDETTHPVRTDGGQR